MAKSYFNSVIRLVLLSILLISVSGCANTSFKVSKESQEITINANGKILLVATSIKYDFAKLLIDDVYEGLQKKYRNISKYEDILPSISINTKLDDVKSFCMENDIKYIIKLEGITCVKLTGYMPPSQKIETYSYYSNGKLQTGTRTVSVPGYNYTYLQAYLLLNIVDIETEKTLVKAQVTTTGSMSAVESHVAQSMAGKIVKKLVKILH